MARKVNQRLWELWRQRIEKQRGSGLSIVKFCRREGLSPATFHLWKRKLRLSCSALPMGHERTPVPRGTFARRAAAADRQPRRDEARQTDGAACAPRFLQLPVGVARTAPWVELVLVDGTIVRVPQQNLAALQTVLEVLRDRRSPTSLTEVSHA